MQWVGFLAAGCFLVVMVGVLIGSLLAAAGRDQIETELLP